MAMLREHSLDFTAPTRALACAVSALKVMGSCGVFARVNAGDQYVAEFYRRLSFFEIPAPQAVDCGGGGAGGEDMFNMGRII